MGQREEEKLGQGTELGSGEEGRKQGWIVGVSVPCPVLTGSDSAEQVLCTSKCKYDWIWGRRGWQAGFI